MKISRYSVFFDDLDIPLIHSVLMLAWLDYVSVLELLEGYLPTFCGLGCHWTIQLFTETITCYFFTIC